MTRAATSRDDRARARSSSRSSSRYSSQRGTKSKAKAKVKAKTKVKAKASSSSQSGLSQDLAARTCAAVEAVRERIEDLQPAQKRRAAGILALVVLAMVSLLANAAWTSPTTPQPLETDPAVAARSSLRAGPVRKRRRRKHLHEICPHIVKTLGKPYENRYTKTLGQPSDTLPRLTTVSRGNIPVVLGVPHGASHKSSKYTWQVDNLLPREGASQEFNASSFQSRLSRVSSDTNTQTMAKKIADIYKKRYKRYPYIVQADFHRRFVDANRRVNHSEACCPDMWPKCTAVADYWFEKDGSPNAEAARRINRARAVYDDYHGSIVQALNEIHTKHPGKPIYLIDVHAQRAVTDEELSITAEDMEETIIVGTQDGRLVRSREELYSPRGLVGQILAQGVKVYPPNNEVADHRLYNGGHGVAEYCVNNTLGGEVNGIQMEFGFRLRMRSKTLEKTAAAIVEALEAVLAI